MVYHLGANEVEEVNGADPAVIARTHELLEPMFPDATYTLETVDTVYIQGPHDGGEVLEAPRGGGENRRGARTYRFNSGH